MAKGFMRLCTLALAACLCACAVAQPAEWPNADAPTPEGVRAWVDERIAAGFEQQELEGFAVDFDQDMVLPLGYVWQRHKHSVRPYAFGATLNGAKAMLLVSSTSQRAMWVHEDKDSPLGIATDKAALKTAGEGALAAFLEDHRGEEGAPVSVRSGVRLVAVGGYWAHEWIVSQQDELSAHWTWGTDRRGYTAVLNAPADEFDYAYTAVRDALAGFVSLVRMPLFADTPPIPLYASTSGLSISTDNFFPSSKHISWNKAYNKAHDLPAADIAVNVVADRYNDITLAVPVIWSPMEVKTNYGNALDRMLWWSLSCDVKGEVRISLSSVPNEGDFVWRDETGAVAYDEEALKNDGFYEWIVYCERLNDAQSGQTPFPVESIGDICYTNVGEYLGLVFLYRTSLDKMHNMFVTWNTGVRQYSCSLHAPAEYWDSAFADLITMLNSFEHYLPPAEHAAYLRSNDY